jgi:hypothetical protein
MEPADGSKTESGDREAHVRKNEAQMITFSKQVALARSAPLRFAAPTPSTPRELADLSQPTANQRPAGRPTHNHCAALRFARVHVYQVGSWAEIDMQVAGESADRDASM